MTQTHLAIVNIDWIKAMKSLNYRITSKKEREATIKEIIKPMLNIQHESKVAPPLEFEKFEAEKLMKYLLSLHTN